MRTLPINNFRGMDLSKDPSQLAPNQCSEMINCELIDGCVSPMKGWHNLFPMDNIPYPDLNDDKSISLITYNTKANKIVFQRYVNGIAYELFSVPLYTVGNTNTPTSISGSMTEAMQNTFTMRDYQYFVTSFYMYRWNGTDANVEAVDNDIAYVPIIRMGSTPVSGGGTDTDQRNMISRKFSVSFSSDGVATVYDLKIAISSSTNDKVSIKVGTTTLVEDTHFTVNRANSTINFAAGTTPHGAPVAGTDNVVITAYYPNDATYTAMRGKILKCKYSVLYGVGTDYRVFLYGNPDYPNMIFWSGVYNQGFGSDPTYWPELNYNEIGDKSSAIMGVSKQLDSLVILKQSNNNDSTVWLLKQNFNDDGTARFDITQGVSGIGMDKLNTLQNIEDKPTFLSNQGVYRISSTNVKDERILEHISLPVDKELLNISDSNYLSFDYDSKFGIVTHYTKVVNSVTLTMSMVYIFDYNLKYIKNNTLHYECYKWDFDKNITSCAVIQGKLYLGCDNGMIYVVKVYADQNKYTWTEYTTTSETKTEIEAYFQTPYLNYGNMEYYKHIQKLNINASANNGANSNRFFISEAYSKDNTMYEDDITLTNNGWNAGVSAYTTGVFVNDINKRDVLQHSFKIKPKGDITINQIDIEYSLGRKYKGVG